MAGVKETREAINGIFELAILLAERLKDGIGIDDITAIIGKLASDEAFKKAMVDAYTGVENIPAEMKDIDMAEGMELATIAIIQVPKIIEAIKK